MSGSPVGMQYRTTSYAAHVFDTFYFEKNLQGDIIAVYNADGDKIGSYTYDAWGNCTVSVVSGNTTLENNIVRTLNPFRYRGYYYDTETGLYYLQSRYYNPAWGRFLNADGYVSTGQGLLGFNMYAYCNNNPVMNIDISGEDLIGFLVVLAITTIVLTMSSCGENASNIPKSDGSNVYYDVACVNQGTTKLCGLYSEAIVEAYYEERPLTKEDANQRVRELQKIQFQDENAEFDPNHDMYPSNRGTAHSIDNIETLASLLQNGPIYASYQRGSDGHMVVVNGVDVDKNIVYTSNPWGIKGSQSFDEFLSGPTLKWWMFAKGGGWELECVYDVDR